MRGVSNKLTRVVILKSLLRAYALACKILVALTIISIPPRTIASEQKLDTTIEAQPLQTEITLRDFKIVEVNYLNRLAEIKQYINQNEITCRYQGKFCNNPDWRNHNNINYALAIQFYN